jgi:hypothetical protein
VTVTICKVDTFPCTGGNVEATVATGGSPGNPWTTGSTSNNKLTSGTEYWAEAVQGSSTSPVFPFVAESTEPSPTNIVLANGGTAGEVDQGDTATVAFSEPLDASTICSGWVNNGAVQSISDATITFTNGQLGSSDTFDVSSTASCTGNGNFGTVNTGTTGYVSSTVTFTNSTITWNPITYTLIFTMGVFGTGSRSVGVTNHTPEYTADPQMTDLSDNAVSTTTVGGTSSRF